MRPENENQNHTGETPQLASASPTSTSAPRRSEIGPGGSHPTVHEAALGGPPAEAVVEACFLWIDEESGDELVIEAQGSASFFAQLEALGFVPHLPLPAGARAEDDRPAAPGVEGERRGESSGVRRSARLDVAKGGAGARRDRWRSRRGA